MPSSTSLSRAVCVALALLPAAHAAAQSDGARQLDRVTVSASTSRMPQSDAALPNTITVIDREALEQQLAVTQDLSQVLSNLIPAFAPPRQKLTSFGESLRGRKPLYMVDGVPQSTPLRDGSRSGHTIDPAMIERVEVIHGANALQGLGASGGIINIITKKAPRKDGSLQEVSFGTSAAVPRNADDLSTRASYLFGTRSGAFDLVAGASYATEGLYYDGDGHAIGVDGTQGDLMDTRSWNLFAKAGWDIDADARLQLTANRYRLRGNGDYVPVPGKAPAAGARSDSGRPATSVRGRQEGVAPLNQADWVSLDYTDRDVFGGTLQAQLFWFDFASLFGGGRFGTYQDAAIAPPGTLFDQSQNESRKTGAKLGWSRRDLFGLPLNATLGVDVLHDRTSQVLVNTARRWVPETEFRSVSPFVQADWRLGDAFLLTGGLRHERAELRVDDYTTLAFYGPQRVRGGRPETRETLKNLGLIWYATPALNLYASYAEGYTVADIGRVLRQVNRPGQQVESLTDLTPVVADNRELGFDYDDGRWRMHGAWYRSGSELGSLLVYDAAADVYNVQRQPTRIHGIEADASVRIGEPARVGAAYARSRGRYDGNVDGRFESDLEGINISPDRATLFWDHTWTPRVSTRLQAAHAFDREFQRNGRRVASFEGYTTADLFARVALPVGALNVGVENLFDRRYVTYYSQTTPADDSYNAGRGRVLNLSWSHRF
ncbi:MAG TPA: TonB-dependent receptor [Lysobacter sp.]